MTREDYLKTAAELDVLEAKAGEKLGSEYEGLRDDAERAVIYFTDAMFPNYSRRPERAEFGETQKSHYISKGATCLERALAQHGAADSEALCEKLIKRLPRIYELLSGDVIAAYRGDPAAKSPDEVILCYPAFTAISTYRIAHELYELGQPMIARLMTEYAHRKTGIDIHPGARIGKEFFIDHGTGVVIGETTVIGDGVKLYQHVTLGAKSFDCESDGSLVKGIKRHPNIGNNVVIYAGATILGGDVFIGDDSVIGGNVWLTESVPAGSTVLANIPEPTHLKSARKC